MQQVGSTQNISLPSQERDDLYKIDLRGRLEEDWPTFHKMYIEMWERRYDFLPTYLERNRHRRHRRPRRGPINPRLGDGDATGSTSAPSTSEDPIVLQPSGQ
ncbi:hypothetical protein Goarm_000774 [Gossypium armourianum]|uniref:Uncharacterized protein n=1 Tax=Gossypium armourianum TaxID=34283 RepID=A0A7J9KAZ9_9ROSI|nr:hypothetical protein [Gossypium armourianum]